jgi:hypothetical protein
MPAIQSQNSPSELAENDDEVLGPEPSILDPRPSILRELSAADILNANDLALNRVDVPEWHGYVFVRSMTAAERDEWELYLISHRTPDGELNFRNVRATLVANTCCDSAGSLLFTPDQVDALAQKCGRAIVRVYEATQRLNAITDDDVQELAKNLPADGSGSSPSVSVSGSAACTPTILSAG